MTRSELQTEIWQLEQQLQKERAKAQELEEKYEVLVTFNAQCETHSSAFHTSVQRRKSRLASVESLVSTVRSALNYQKKMNEALNGADYRNTASSIEQLLDSVSRTKADLRKQAEDCDSRITYLSGKIQQLKAELSAMPEEETEND